MYINCRLYVHMLYFLVFLLCRWGKGDIMEATGNYMILFFMTDTDKGKMKERGLGMWSLF